MTEFEHQEFVRKNQSGVALLGVDRQLARRLFSEWSAKDIDEHTGQYPASEISIVLLSTLTSQLIFLASLVISIFAFRWWALAVIPASIFAYSIVLMQSALPRSNLLFLTITFGFVAYFHFVSKSFSTLVGWYLICAISSFWVVRLVYVACTYFVQMFALKSVRGFNFLSDLEIIHVVEKPWTRRAKK